MLTIFTTCKPLVGHDKVIQTNAVTSWTHLNPRPQVIIVGDDEGTADLADQLKIEHIPGVRKSRYGTPYLDSIFEEVRKIARHDYLCYSNADMILLGDFIRSVTGITSMIPSCLIIGFRYDVRVEELIDFSGDWESELKKLPIVPKNYEARFAMDYFAFHKDIYDRIPPFAVGRGGGWDGWLVYYARARGFDVVDISEAARPLHQMHDYADFYRKTGMKGIDPSDTDKGINVMRSSEEGVNNARLAAGSAYCIDDATYKLTGSGLVRQTAFKKFMRASYRKTGDIIRKVPVLASIARKVVRAFSKKG